MPRHDHHNRQFTRYLGTIALALFFTCTGGFKGNLTQGYIDRYPHIEQEITDAAHGSYAITYNFKDKRRLYEYRISNRVNGHRSGNTAARGKTFVTLQAHDPASMMYRVGRYQFRQADNTAREPVNTIWNMTFTDRQKTGKVTKLPVRSTSRHESNTPLPQRR